MERANDPQGSALTAEEDGILRRLCLDLPAEDLATVDACKVKRFVRSHGLTNHKDSETRYAATLKSVREHLEWRRRKCVDDFLKPETKVGARVLTRLRRWRELWGSEVYGVTQAGVPVMYHHMGGLQPKVILEEFSGDAMEDGLIFDLELCEKLNEELSRQQGRQINLGVAVIDLRDIGMDLMSPKLLSKIKLMIDLPSNHYPESLTHMYIVNAPLTFRGFWRLVLPFIPDENKLKISLLGTDRRALQQVFQREGIDTRRFPQEIGGGVPAGHSPALGWLGAAYQRGVSTGEYVSEGVDLESTTGQCCPLDPVAQVPDATADEKSAASTKQAPAVLPRSLSHKPTVGSSSETLAARSLKREQERRMHPHRRQERQERKQRHRGHGGQGKKEQQGRPKSSGHRSAQQRRVQPSVVAAQSSKGRVKQGGVRFSCCASAPQEAMKTERRTRRPAGVTSAAKLPSVKGTTRSVQHKKQLPPTGTDTPKAAIDPQLPIGIPPHPRVHSDTDRSIHTSSSPAMPPDDCTTWCMSVSGTDAPSSDTLHSSPNASSRADPAWSVARDTRLVSPDRTVAVYWSSVQSSLHGVLSSADGYDEKRSRFRCVDSGMARTVEQDWSPSEDSHDGSDGDDSPVCHVSQKSLPIPCRRTPP